MDARLWECPCGAILKRIMNPADAMSQIRRHNATAKHYAAALARQRSDAEDSRLEQLVKDFQALDTPPRERPMTEHQTEAMRALHPWHGYITNFDHTIEDGFEDMLRAEPGEVYGVHSAHNFNGRVWYADGRFFEEVWVYGTPRGTLTADTLKDLMALVNDEYGWD